MKTYLTFILFNVLALINLSAQNNILRGQIAYLNSGKKPATGVKVAGTIKAVEASNSTHTSNGGAFELEFPKARTGHLVHLTIGNTDNNSVEIEVVNTKELEICRIPATVTEVFKIIVCKKGERDLAAQHYYKIFKTSSDLALRKKEKELNTLLNERQKDYTKIADLTATLDKLQKQADSATIYQEALRIASINKDDASKRILRYIQLLDEGKSIQEAREALSIKEAAKELGAAAKGFNAAIEMLEIRAGASEGIFDYQDAIECYDTIIWYSEKMNIDKLILASYFMKLGSNTYFLGDYNKALEYQKRGLKIQELLLDSMHNNLAYAYNNISITYGAKDEYKDALYYAKKGVYILEKTLKPNDPHLAIAYGILGNAYFGVNEYNEALIFQKKAIDIQKNSLTSDHKDLATSYSNIASTLLYLGNHQEALEYQQKCLEIREKILKPNDPSLSTSYNNLAVIYRFWGKYGKALEYHQKAMDIDTMMLKPFHPNLATTYNEIALTYKALRDFEKVLEFEQKSLSILKICWDSTHTTFATAYNNMGNTKYVLKKYEEALNFQQKAIKIQEATLDFKSPNLLNYYNNIALTYNALGQLKKALEYQQKVLVVEEELMNPNHPSLAISYNNIASTYRELTQYGEALKYLEKAMAIEELVLNPEHPSLAATYHNIARTHADMAAFNKAIYFQKKSLTIFKQSLPENHPYQQEALNSLIAMYYHRAQEAVGLKKYQQALFDLDTLNSYKNDISLCWDLIGRCYYNLSDYPQSILAYNKALSLSQEIKKQHYYNNIGLSHAKNNQYPEAFNAFTEYEKLYPNEGRTYRNWAMYYSLKKDKQKALSNLQKAIDLGYKDLEFLKSDNSLDNLRKEKAFTELIEKLEKGQNKP